MSSAGLARFDADGLACDYHASWHVSHSGLNERYFTILDDLGTGTWSTGRGQVSPGPSLPPGAAADRPSWSFA